MNKKECENQILEKLKEIKAIVKEYDKSNEGHLSICIIDDYISCANRYWETNTPIHFAEFDDGEVIHFDD